MKYLKRFATHQQYLDYIANEVNSTHFVGTCDDDHTLEDPFKSHYISNNGKLIEYIYCPEGNANWCCIDTGLMCNDDYWEFHADVEVLSWSNTGGSYPGIFGNHSGTNENTNRYRVIASQNATNGTVLVMANTKNQTTFTTLIPINQRKLLKLKYGSLTVIPITNGVQGTASVKTLTSTTKGVATTETMCVNSGSIHNSRYGVAAKWWKFDAYHNNKLVLALRPFKRYSDDRRGMIDLLTGNEFYNAAINQAAINNEWLGSE